MRRALFAAALLLAVLPSALRAESTAFESAVSAEKSGDQSGERIDHVELDGVTAFSKAEIESVLEIGSGDLIDRGKVIHTAENLMNLYRNRGYDSVRVDPRIVKKREHGEGVAVLEYEITEGKPIRLSDVQIKLLHGEDAVLQKYWLTLEPKLQLKLGILPGDLRDQDKLSNAKHALQEVLNSEEFIGAKVDDVRLVPSVDPKTSLTAKDKTAERWESAQFMIDLGDRVTFGFRGNQSVTSARLYSLIDELKAVGLGKDYVDAIRFRLEEEYRSLGFAHVSIRAYPFERPERHERHITYEIAEGGRVRLEALRFDGNSVFSSEALREHFFEKASPALASGYYVEREIQKTSELLIDWLKSKGYLSSKLITINHEYPLKPLALDTGKFADVTVYLYEGEQTSVRRVDFTGNQAFTAAEIKHILGVEPGQPLNLFVFSDGLESLKSAYRNKGYLAMKISNENTDTVVNYAEENRVADVSLQIVEGPKYKTGTVTIEGLTQTKEHVVRRELLFHEGDVLEESKITGSEARLHRLGIFSVVTIQATDDPERQDIKDVTVSVQEGTPGIVAGGTGLRNDLGLRVFNQVGYQNLWGENQTMVFNGTANHRFEDFHFVEYEAQLAYVWPWFMLGETTFRPTATLSGTEYIDFDAVTAQLALTWERKLVTHPNLTGSFTYSLERVVQFNAQDATDNQGLRIGSVIPQLRLDMRDNPLNPTSGFFASASYELATPWLFSQHDPFPVGYTIANFRGDYYQPITRDMTLYLSFRTGFERSLENQVTDPNTGLVIPTSGTIPLIKQFALGGIGSLRGYQDQELNLSGFNVFTASFVNYRAELTLPFAGAMKIAGFLDAANLLTDTYSLTQNLLYGAGFGLRYQTPVGPVNLDWGFKLNPLPDTQTQQFYFSIGII